MKPIFTPEQESLLTYLGKLKITAKTSRDMFGKEYVCRDIGKKVKIAFLCTEDEKDYRLYLEERSSGERSTHARKMLEKYRGELKVPMPVRLLKRFLLYEQLLFENPGRITSRLIDDIDERGVELSERQVREPIEKPALVHNSSHLYVNKGWTLNELQKRHPQGVHPVVSFGSGKRQSFADGGIDRDEPLRKFAEMDIPVEEL